MDAVKQRFEHINKARRKAAQDSDNESD